MSRDIRRHLAKCEEEADRAREEAGMMSRRKLAAILYTNMDLQRAIWGAATSQKGGCANDRNADKTAPS